MSATAERMPLSVARATAAELMRRWWIDPQQGAIVGSVRRGLPDVGDIELIAPLPLDGKEDVLFNILTKKLRRPAAPGFLFGPIGGDGPGKYGDIVKGVADRFKACQVMIDRKSGGQIQVDIYRYTPGPQGNRGWCEVVRTGSADFTRALATHWKKLNRYGPERKGSDEGWLLDQDMKPIPTPSELSVFHRMRLLYVEPHLRRDEHCLLQLDWIGDSRCSAAVRRAAAALEIPSEAELFRLRDDQKFAAAAAGVK